MKINFKKELVVTKKDNEDFENSPKCLICDNDYVVNDVKIRDHCHVTGNYRGSAHRDCNINVKQVQCSNVPAVLTLRSQTSQN